MGFCFEQGELARQDRGFWVPEQMEIARLQGSLAILAQPMEAFEFELNL